jgi:hypothetical protein
VAFANGIRNISLHRGRIHLRDNTAIIIIEREFAELRLANEPSSLAMFAGDLDQVTAERGSATISRFTSLTYTPCGTVFLTASLLGLA